MIYLNIETNEIKYYHELNEIFKHTGFPPEPNEAINEFLAENDYQLMEEIIEPLNKFQKHSEVKEVILKLIGPHELRTNAIDLVGEELRQAKIDDIKEQINIIESRQTPRLLREAYLGDEYSNDQLNEMEQEISILRGQLHALNS